MRREIRVAELFAGVGGFRVGLEAASDRFRVTFANQWEPSRKHQFAAECYAGHFEGGIQSAPAWFNADIEAVLNAAEHSRNAIGPFDLVVGGFPCQDYSVAKPKNQSEGLKGKKGVLWWQIYRLLSQQHPHPPRWVVLENVDRLLSSPAHQRGRDFAIILHCLMQLGYAVEWRVINAADYGYPQKRRRVFIVAKRAKRSTDAHSILLKKGVLARAFPADMAADARITRVDVPEDLQDVSDSFGKSRKSTPFSNAGFAQSGGVWTVKLKARSKRKQRTLAEVLEPVEKVPQEFFVSAAQLPKWRAAKGGKDHPRINRQTGATYRYKEGSIPFPDNLDSPARTILTSEGGSAPSRTTHIIEQSGRYRRLLPVELERLNGFKPGWTEGMSPAQRAFCMGNALVVGLVTQIGKALLKDEEDE